MPYPLARPVFVLLLGWSACAGAQAHPDASAEARACVDVEVNGYRSVSYDCLTQQLTPAAAPRPAAPAPSASAATNMPNQLGLFNSAAFQHRMAGNAGKSAIPQHAVPGLTPP